MRKGIHSRTTAPTAVKAKVNGAWSMTQRNRLLIVFLTIVALFASACTRTADPGTQGDAHNDQFVIGKRGGTISYRLTSAPKTLNYLRAPDEASIVAAYFLLTSRLVEFDHRAQKYVPGLAETWRIDQDGVTVSIKLREGLKFSDGRELNADDVIFTLNAMYDERTQSPVFRDAMLIDGKPIAAKRITNTEVQFVFPKAVANVENYLANVGVLPAGVLEPEMKAGKLAEAWAVNSPPASIVSSGPFTIEATTPGERIEYVRNPNYWKKDNNGTQLPYIDKLKIEIIPDANNTFARLNQGNIDIGDRVRTSDFTEFSKVKGDVRPFDVGPGLGIDHMWFNLNTVDSNGAAVGSPIKREWFNDKRFRKAIALAIDRETIATVTLQGLATPLYGFVSPGNRFWISPDLPKINYDLAQAEKLLLESGFVKAGTPESPALMDSRNNPVEFTLILPVENEARKLMAAVIQEDLSKLGIKMQIAPIEFPAVTERWNKTYDYDAVLLGLSQTDTEPSSFASFLLSNAAAHQWRPKQKTPATEWEARIDKLFSEQSVERDQEKRKMVFAEIQSIVADEMPVIPIVSRHIVSAANRRIGNLSPSGIMPFSLWNVEELFVR